MASRSKPEERGALRRGRPGRGERQHLAVGDENEDRSPRKGAGIRRRVPELRGATDTVSAADTRPRPTRGRRGKAGGEHDQYDSCYRGCGLHEPLRSPRLRLLPGDASRDGFADHVVALSTIVSRERSLRAAVPIGVCWGVGPHGSRSALVGTAIVAYGLVIPPRLGLLTELLRGGDARRFSGIFNLRAAAPRSTVRGNTSTLHSQSPVAVARGAPLVVALGAHRHGARPRRARPAIALLALGTVHSVGWSHRVPG